ncbi:MAG TPA: hypothetical protein VHQ94_04820 [Pyrinomonadaceae bacterium]|jgi:hypothetical protein|nr:hypothetical protein [Pyrinomonadaceae bacterium]
MPRRTTTSCVFTILATLVIAAGCKSIVERRQDVKPRVLRDVPSQNLAYRLTPDTTPPTTTIEADDPLEKVEAIATDFSTKRTDDALLRTVKSPDGRRVLAVYAAGDEAGAAFRIDLYSAEGQFLRNVVPPDLSCFFPETVSWSPDGNSINFIARKRVAASPTPTPPPEVLPDPSSSPQPVPSVAPVFAPVASFSTEQIYISNRDGYELKPLTAREGLIYFYFAWAPDGHAIVALACKEDEWNDRERQSRTPAGRPRLIMLDGSERLLDDGLTDALPVWSPDASKVATAFNTDVAIYDAVSNTPTQARIALRDQLISASLAYDQAAARRAAPSPAASPASSPSPSPSPSSSREPASFNPIIRLEWPSPEHLYFQTAYVRLRPIEAFTFPRWHLLNLSAQAAILK